MKCKAIILVLCNIAVLDVFRFILFAAGHVKIYIGFYTKNIFLFKMNLKCAKYNLVLSRALDISVNMFSTAHLLSLDIFSGE